MPYTNAPGTAAVVVSVPPGAGVPHAYLFNPSGQVAYLGGSAVSTVNGFPLYPNNRIDLSNSPGTIWAVAGFTAIATPVGTVTTGVAPGGTTLTTAFSASGFGAGTAIVIEAGSPRQEFNVISTFGTASTTLASALVYGHGSGATFSYFTPQVTTVQAVRGAT